VPSRRRSALNRLGIPVAKCTVGRLKRAHRWRGATRGRRVRTTVPNPAASRAPDLVRRRFKASRPGQLHVADFTYVPLPGGRFAYTALVIDAFARRVPLQQDPLGAEARAMRPSAEAGA